MIYVLVRHLINIKKQKMLGKDKKYLCSVCGQERLTQPYKNTVCSHTYCLECIQGQNVRDQKFIKCLEIKCFSPVTLNELDQFIFNQAVEYSKAHPIPKSQGGNTSEIIDESQNSIKNQSIQQLQEHNFDSAKIQECGKQQIQFQIQQQLTQTKSARKMVILTQRETTEYCGCCFLYQPKGEIKEKPCMAHSICFKCFHRQLSDFNKFRCELCSRFSCE